MKLKALFISLFVLILSASAFAQNPKDKKKAPRDKHDNMWSKKIFKHGKDTRFTKHKRKKFRKPGDDH